MAYDTSGTAAVDRAARALPEEALARWQSAVAALVPAEARRGVRLVVDLGCGTNRFVGGLSRAFGAPVLGLDPSTHRRRCSGSAAWSAPGARPPRAGRGVTSTGGAASAASTICRARIAAGLPAGSTAAQEGA